MMLIRFFWVESRSDHVSLNRPIPRSKIIPHRASLCDRSFNCLLWATVAIFSKLFSYVFVYFRKLIMYSGREVSYAVMFP